MYLLYGQIVIFMLNIIIESPEYDHTNLVRAQMELDRAYRPIKYFRPISDGIFIVNNWCKKYQT